ncbi:MAG TPA: alpha/beta hydrolase [Candidatus Acidoferrum sp.]|nr:alpha/beta hydrolase [Candidatus Acidoferrum sp.]
MSSRSWEHTEGSFEGARGTRIYYQAWTPSKKPKAVLVIAHGIGEHSGRYTHVADYLTKKGFAVWACDHRGHGKSGGKRGHVDNFDDYLADLDQTIRIAKQKTPEMKTFLMGHSLGGLIATFYAEKHSGELDGLIVSGPALREKMKISSSKAFMAKTLSSIMPTLSTGTGLDPNLLSHDKEVVKKYVEDPLVHKVTTPRWFTEYRQAQEETMRSADKLTLPCLIIQGGADGIVDPTVAKDLYDKIKSPDKTLKVYDGFYHESLNEIGKESVLADIDTWLSARI